MHSINKVHLRKTICFEEVCDNAKKSTHFHSNNSIIYTYQFHATFGSIMPGRYFSSGTGYRWGINGKEMDNEIFGNGNQYDYGFRIYNLRIGKFLSVDPLTKSYPWYTPYQFAGNMPIIAIDLDGLEEFVIIRWYDSDNKYVGSTTFNVPNSERIENTGTLIVNKDVSMRESIHSERGTGNLGSTTRSQLFKIENGVKSLNGGKILSEPINKNERQATEKLKLTSNKNQWINTTYGKTTINYVNPDQTTNNVDPVIIENVKNVLVNNPEFAIEVEGHASAEPGVSEAHNQILSEKRAADVKNELVSGGANGSQIKTSGAGSNKPLPNADNSSEAKRSLNRRAEIKLTIPRDLTYD